jgi:hypothetical protein
MSVAVMGCSAVQSLPVALISGRALNGMARQFRADTFEKAFFG